MLRQSTCISHHIFSSIWSAIKNEFLVIKENSSWIIGNGENINFWLDAWCGDPLIQSLNLQPSQISNFPPRLCNYIQNAHWHILVEVGQLIPILNFLVSQVTLPSQPHDDLLIWKHTTYGALSLKDACDFKKHHFPKVQWAKIIWSKDFPPSKSLLVWRLMLGKLPTDENLSARGCSLPSMCSLCGNNA